MRGLNWSLSVDLFLLFSSFLPSLLPDSRVKQKNHYKEVKGQIEIFWSSRQPEVLNWVAGTLGWKMVQNQPTKQTPDRHTGLGRSIIALRAGELGAERMLQTWMRTSFWFRSMFVQIHIHPPPFPALHQPSRGVAKDWIREQWAEGSGCDRHVFLSRSSWFLPAQPS